MSDRARMTTAVLTTAALAVALLATSVLSPSWRLPAARAQGGDPPCVGGSCGPCTDPPCSGCPCLRCGKLKNCDNGGGSTGGGGGSGGGGGGGGTPPTLPPPTEIPVPLTCGNGACDAGEHYWNCPGDCDPPPTPTPIPWGDEITYYCIPWPGCPEGYANVTVYKGVDGGYAVVDVVCLPESACVRATPVPEVTPTPIAGGGNPNAPCDIEPFISGGILRQPCDDWDWEVEVEAAIPPAPVLRNPWPRGIVGMENCLWYLGSADVENWSDEAELCPNAVAGVTSDESSFDCGNGTTASKGAKVNYQVGAAWRQWREGDDPVLGYTPPAEITWVIPDREWNGGEIMLTGPQVCYTFETSSYGLGEWGPRWNPACQEQACDCDERVLDYLGEESYNVTPSTFWYPEYSFRHLEYVCTHTEWSDCFCRESAPVGRQTQGCSDCGCPEGWWCGRVGQCDQWGWVERQEPWTTYDLTALGFANPLLASTSVIVAGADADGTQCGSWTDAWPCYVPVPVLELQPAGVPDHE